MNKYKCKNKEGETEYLTWLLVTNEYKRTNPKSKLQTAYIPVSTVCQIVNAPKVIGHFNKRDFSQKDFR